MKLFIFIFLLLIGANCLAQTTVAGTVKDAQNNPLQNATLSLFYKGNITAIKTTQTNSTGHYEFKNIADGYYFIKATFIWKKVTAAATFFVEEGKNIAVPDLMLTDDNSLLKSATVSASTSPLQAKAGKLIYNIERTLSATGSNAFLLLLYLATNSIIGVSAITAENIHPLITSNYHFKKHTAEFIPVGTDAFANHEFVWQAKEFEAKLNEALILFAVMMKLLVQLCIALPSNKSSFKNQNAIIPEKNYK